MIHTGERIIDDAERRRDSVLKNATYHVVVLSLKCFANRCDWLQNLGG
jgi:hypothetical protein